MGSIRGKVLKGMVISTKMKRTIIIRRNYLHYVKKFHRFEKRHSNMPVHCSPAFDPKELPPLREEVPPLREAPLEHARALLPRLRPEGWRHCRRGSVQTAEQDGALQRPQGGEESDLRKSTQGLHALLSSGWVGSDGVHEDAQHGCGWSLEDGKK